MDAPLSSVRRLSHPINVVEASLSVRFRLVPSSSRGLFHPAFNERAIIYRRPVLFWGERLWSLFREAHIKKIRTLHGS